jgi:seryl-tRNA synthetase
MLDIKLIRENAKEIQHAIKTKGSDIDIEKLLKIDDSRRELIKKEEYLRAEKNKVAKLGKSGVEEGKRIKEELQKLEPKITKINEEFTNLMYQIPNVPAKDVPIGKDDKENKVIKKEKGIKLAVSAKNIKDHAELGKLLDLIDTEQASKVSGSRFAYLKNEAVLLQFALVNFVFDILIKEKFIPIIPPLMEKFEVARGTGHFETLSDDAYHLKQDDLILIGTSEQTIVPYLSEKILGSKDLPKRYVGYSTCFRREAGSYGKDVQGIIRQHQFDKLEMVSFTKPEDSEKEHQMLLSLEEKIVKSLEIPYQVLNICTGDLGLPAAKKYDIECYLPSQDRYLETHSTSNCTDFQSRRLNIKYRTDDGKTAYVHTLNGTAVAIGRMLIAIIENYQQEDGSIIVPKVLQKYTGFKEIKTHH